MTRTRRAWGAAAVLMAASVVSAAFMRQQGVPPLSPEAKQAFLLAWAAEPRVNVDVPSGGAKVVILKFSDWQCPGCKATHMYYDPILDAIEKAQPGSVKFVVKDFPLNVRCNFNWPTTGPQHPGTCEAAVAARVAKDNGKAAEMADWLWANQEATPSQVKASLKQITQVKTDFDQLYALKMIDIARDITSAGVLRVQSTPTYYVNGVRIRGFVNGAWDNGTMLVPDLFEVAVRHELTSAK